MSTAKSKKPTRPSLPVRPPRLPRAVRAERLPAERLLGDLRGLIEQAREQVARAVNAGLVGLYWQIGRRIRQDILHERRAEYGEQIVSLLSAQLTAEYGRGFSRQNLFRMISFAEAFPDEQIVSALSRQLSWSHFVEILVLEDPLKRQFYAELCRVERWSTRTLQSQIKRLVYERTAVSKQPEEVIRAELAVLRDEDRMEIRGAYRAHQPQRGSHSPSPVRSTGESVAIHRASARRANRSAVRTVANGCPFGPMWKRIQRASPWARRTNGPSALAHGGD